MNNLRAEATADEVRGWCDRVGLRPDSPFRAATLATMEAAIAARKVATAAHGLTPEVEGELVRRVAEAAAAGAEREMARLSRRVELRTGLVLAAAALLLLGGGYAAGRWEAVQDPRAEALRDATFLAQLAELNDLGALRRACERNAYQQEGRRACDLPPVWIGAAAR